MNKSDLIDAISEDSGLSKADSGKALNSFINTVSTALAKGDQITLVGFGNFGVKERASRKGRNPLTGEALEIKGGRVPTFKAFKSLKDAVAGGK